VVVDNEQNYITTFIMGDPRKQKLVLIHGYGGSGALLYRLFPELINDFHVFAIDIIGMGSSSRPDFNCKDGTESDLYMLGFLERWRVAMDSMTDFVLVGHSYGAYLAGSFAAL
jgi:pimeloyl-ACP methyl ester carboxylesterase